MAWRQSWFAVRAAKDAAVSAVGAAERDAPAYALPSDFGLGIGASWTSFDLQGLIEEDNLAFDWAQAASAHAPGPGLCVGFFILEGLWSWGCFARGEQVAGMRWFPDRFPSLRGDLARAGKLLGVPEQLLRDYCVGHPFGDLDEDDLSAAQYDSLEQWGGFRAREGDRFPPWDEYGFYDFADRLGIPEPGIEPWVSNLEHADHSGDVWNHVRLSGADTVFTFEPAAFRALHLGASTSDD